MAVQVEDRNLYRITSRQKCKTTNSSDTTIRNSHPPLCSNLLVLSLFLIGWIGSWAQAIKRGNAHYQAGAYDAALEAYQSAAAHRPEEAISRYNLGTVLYQKKQFEHAADQFRQALDTVDPIYRAQGYYNLGNAQAKLNDIEGAIQSYKSALRLNPTDVDTKYNLELALERLEQKPQQNQSEAGEEDKDRQEQEQEQQQSNQQNRDEQEPNQQNQDPPAASDQQQQNQELSEQKSTAEESSLQSERESMQQPVEMSKEDAIRLLDAVKDDEKEIQKRLLQKRFSGRQRPEKDW